MYSRLAKMRLKVSLFAKQLLCHSSFPLPFALFSPLGFGPTGCPPAGVESRLCEKGREGEGKGERESAGDLPAAPNIFARERQKLTRTGCAQMTAPRENQTVGFFARLLNLNWENARGSAVLPELPDRNSRDYF